MGLEDAINAGKDFIEKNADKVNEALHSEQAEQISDNVLDGVAGFAKKIVPGQADAIDDLRDKADGAIGNE